MHCYRLGLGLLLLVGLLAPAASVVEFEEEGYPGRSASREEGTTLEKLLDSDDPYLRLGRMITVAGLARKTEETDGMTCVRAGDRMLCLHPDTDPAYVDELLRRLPVYPGEQGKVQYNKASRWGNTATDGTNTGLDGDPITLTWGLLPDGVNIPGGGQGAGEPSGPSDLQAVFDAHISPAVWRDKIRQALDQWGMVIGLTHVEVAYDDSAAFPNSTGLLGVRPDVRIGGHSIDGGYGILAYNYYPDGGDMVIDTDDWPRFDNTGNDYRYLRNLITHEHGHGLGLGHVIPINATKLMEPYISTAYDGPQDDDLRGGMRLYGDFQENDDAVEDAAVLGLISGPVVISDLCIDRGPDKDWYRLSAPGGGEVTIEVMPIGSTYSVGPEGGSASSINTKEISDPEIELYDNTGTVLLALADSAPIGQTEVLSSFPLPGPGDYTIRIGRTAGSGFGTQRYTLTITLDVSTDVATGGLPAPEGRNLSLSVNPNPFNPAARLRFDSPGAGPYAVEVFDLAGRLVRRFDGNAPGAATVEVVWDGKDERGHDAAAGVYLVRVGTSGQGDVRRAVLIR